MKSHHPLKPWKRQAAAVLALSFVFASQVVPIQAAPDVPFLVSAYDAAAKKPDNPGISATVTMTTLGTGAKPPKVLVA